MLFPITIFPCGPFASDIFLLNESAETESSCPLGDFAHTPPLGSGPAPAPQLGGAGRPLCIPRGVSYRIPEACAGRGAGYAAATTRPQPQGHCPGWGAWAYGPQMASSCFSPRPFTLEREKERERERETTGHLGTG